MRMPRVSLGYLTVSILIIAMGLAALRSGTEAWAGVMLLSTCGFLVIAVAGALCRSGAARAFWLGFALAGLGFLYLAHDGVGLYDVRKTLPTVTIMDAVRHHLCMRPRHGEWM